MADTCVVVDSKDTLEDSLERMRETLKEFYGRRDNRAIFLRAYYTMTSEVRDALRGEGDFAQPIFFDSKWVEALAAGFAQLYFDSLETPRNKAWALAHGTACKPRASVLENLLLGINAHINVDLAFSVHTLLVGGGEATNLEQLARRKFDHDQINNVLMRSLPKIQDVLAREFGGGVRFFSRLFGKVDELLTITGLRYYRDRVWCNVLGLLAAKDAEERRKVELRLEWESLQVAEFISQGSLLNYVAWGFDSLLKQWRFEEPQLEPTADRFSIPRPLRSQAQQRMYHRLQLPY
ncbi:DUF5995 family protein [Hyalangium rubrum]|uniref:DUF5995 family protein n=1 Tax=Hyalangium rubrum TaxID=3103134 RepID=A0ABU5H9R1_9BACT|nr:DUF5995 family protein [Hyalangium sp. s54d21]MDY7230210.1 DUF5995 family protein [Hyalangium sp. s54d21]